jgi:Flp pilus assembly pilin Flp
MGSPGARHVLPPENYSMALLIELLRRDDGQDVVEYALLTAAIGFAGAVTLRTMRTTMNIIYSSWGSAVNNLWETP